MNFWEREKKSMRAGTGNKESTNDGLNKVCVTNFTNSAPGVP